MKLKYILSGILLFSCFLSSFAQEQKKRRRDNDKISIHRDTINYKPVTLTTDEFRNYHLPALEVLFENARNNPRMKAVESAMRASRAELRSARKDWLQYFSLRAGYTYGILGTYTDTETQYNPLTTVYSGATQSSWSIGANINIPLNTLFNQNSKIKQQREKYIQSQYDQEIIFNEIKNEIIEIYCNIQYQLKLLKIATESQTLYDADFNVSESNFINDNNNQNRLLSDIKHSHQVALTEYETIVNNLNILFLKLEIISNTKIINK
ncbi:TolC family protein [uncultured Odoribacter sp.]|uniref:TolC family protein n=1 Tax=uncultured Odoribacter sp. TaxID=876416 RepID=UPI00260207F6|nr:TolC family protein [uncultured Odoribacter sp.]